MPSKDTTTTHLLATNGSNGYIDEDIDGDEPAHNGNQDIVLNIEDSAAANQNGGGASAETELVFIQDSSFTIKVSAPGLDNFEIQVNTLEIVQEIHQLLMDREDTCHRTCFCLQLDGVTLDKYAELKVIPGLKEGSVLKVVEGDKKHNQFYKVTTIRDVVAEPYNVREAKLHVRHVWDLIRSLDMSNAYNGAEGSSLSYLNVVTQGDVLDKKGRLEVEDCTPPDCILPGASEPPLSLLQPMAKDAKEIAKTLKWLDWSKWNPPPGKRRLNGLFTLPTLLDMGVCTGDLLYLDVVTMEDKKFVITSSTRGFYVNQSSGYEFDPKPAHPTKIYHSLVDLLNQLSPAFKRNFALIQKKRTQKHPFERVATPYQVTCWAAPSMEHTLDAIRAEDAFSSKLGYEEHIPGQTREWNEELQTTRELQRSTLPERLMRERAIFKVHSDFVAAATRGAISVIDGNVVAINPGEDSRMHMFIWNNIFFSLGFDVRDHYSELGGDAAAYAAPINDLQGVRAYATLDPEKIYTLGTVVVDYRGYRVTAQSIIPGILEQEQEQSVVYGSVDFGKTVVASPKYLDLLKKSAEHLKILPHNPGSFIYFLFVPISKHVLHNGLCRVLNEKDQEVELYSSVECKFGVKGIVGNDGRHYILDLLRTFPPDVNYLITEDPPSEVAKSMGYPVAHKHKLCCLRQELIDAFHE
ncbi:CLUH [Cordylochernes scorpioides]|uniref:CLUH n=1 Tax=Cordylochernes scorpioides TaxID=51811 RepID=A0ABY6K7A6_9ARAC|nr:CLUH [Cordylochernes scorpioides]